MTTPRLLEHAARTRTEEQARRDVADAIAAWTRAPSPECPCDGERTVDPACCAAGECAREPDTA